MMCPIHLEFYSTLLIAHTVLFRHTISSSTYSQDSLAQEEEAQEESRELCR